MSDYTRTLNTLERMSPYDPVPVEILPIGLLVYLDGYAGTPDGAGDLTVSEALDCLLRDWGTVPNVIHGLNGPDTYFDTSGTEHEAMQAWVTDSGLDPATVVVDPVYFDHTNNVLTYAEYDPVLAPQVKHMTQHTMQDIPPVSLLGS